MSSSSVFISCVSSEFGATRQAFNDVLRRLGYTPVSQEIFGTESGDLRKVLREKIDRCEGLIQIVGHGYGAEPPVIDENYGRVSYTQFEFLYAREKGKKTWLFFPGEGCTRDTSVDLLDLPLEANHPAPEDFQAERRLLQQKYRQARMNDGHVYHQAQTDPELLLGVERLRDELKTLQEVERAWRRKVLSAIVFTSALVFLALAIAVWSLVSDWRRSFDQWVTDDYVGVRVVERAAGTILAEEPYEIQLEVKNKTTMPIIINHIVVISRNQEAANLFGRSSPKVFKHNHKITHHLKGNEVKNLPISLNQILPEEIVVKVRHNLAAEPSEFLIDLKADALPMPPPRYLDREVLFRGYDSMTALRQATAAARRWSADAALVAMFPGDNKVYIDKESLLKFTVVESWVTTFYSRKYHRIFMAMISSENIESGPVEKPPEEGELPTPCLSDPELGIEQAIDISNRASLLSADWNGPRLGSVDVLGESICAWFLPYRAPDGMPIIIDATTGDKLEPQDEDTFRRIPIDVAPVRNPEGDRL
jgi:hypothetical protein